MNYLVIYVIARLIPTRLDEPVPIPIGRVEEYDRGGRIQAAHLVNEAIQVPTTANNEGRHKLANNSKARAKF